MTFQKLPDSELESFVQSIWLDYLRCNALEIGEIELWIDQDGVSGLTSNPSIFEKAIVASHDYDNAIRSMVLQGGPVGEIVAGLHGQVAIASAKVADQIYQEIFGSKRYRKLAQMGARTQRLLWASTGTKNPKYSDVKYVETLISCETINTIPPETLNAYREHGKPSSPSEEGTQEAYRVLEALRQSGVDLDASTQELEDEGVTKFSQAFEQLMAALQEKRAVSFQELVNP